jgi:hypothetical protein
VVTIELESSAAAELHAPAEWFTLADEHAEYPEVGVVHPGIGAALVAIAERGAHPLALPFTSIPKGKTMLVLVYDVPKSMKAAALLVGAEELALKVVLP